MGLIHWFTNNKKFESNDTVALLEAILVCLFCCFSDSILYFYIIFTFVNACSFIYIIRDEQFGSLEYKCRDVRLQKYPI